MAELFQSAYFALSPKKSAHYFSRWGHTAIPISNQLYCFGGKKPNTKSKDNDPYYKIDSYTLEVQKVQAQGLFSTDSHSTIRIGGKILLWGGMKQQQGTNRCYRFDIDNDTWTQVKQFGEIPPPRDSHCVENINNRWMLLFGGNTTKELPKTANDFYLLDTISMKWKKVNIIKGIIPAFRQDATLTAVGKHFYLFGGMGKQQIFLNDLYKITLNSPDFTVSQPQIFIQQIIISGTLPSQRANHSAVQYKNRFLVVFSGQGKSDQLPLQKNDDDSDKRSQDMLILRDVWVFDSEKINWFQLKPKNSDLYKGRISFTATLFRDCILLVGGLKTLRNTHKNILVLHIKQPHPLVTQLQQGPKSKLERSTSQYTSQKHQILKQRKHIVRYKQNALNQYNQNPRLIVTQSFLQSMTKSIRNPIRAIGLIVEQQVDLGALYINIKIKNSIQIHSHNQKYIIINTDSKKWQYQQFLKVMCSLDIRPKDIIKKNKQEIQYKQQMDQELQITRKFGTLIKLCSLRLGRSFIYITKQKLNTIAFSISSKYQDPEITPFFFSQQLNIPLTNIQKRNKSMILQDFDMAGPDLFQSLDEGNHLIVYDLYRQYQEFELEYKHDDFCYDLKDNLEQPISLRKHLQQIFMIPPIGRKICIQGEEINLRNQKDQYNQRCQKNTSLQLQIKNNKQFSYCNKVYLNLKAGGGIVAIYFRGRLIKKVKSEGAVGCIQVPNTMFPTLLSDRFENLRLEQALLNSIRVLGNLKRERENSE